MKKFHYLNFVLKYFTPPITNVRFELIMRSFPWLNCLCQIVKDMAWAMNLLLMWGYISFDDDNGRKLFFSHFRKSFGRFQPCNFLLSASYFKRLFLYCIYSSCQQSFYRCSSHSEGISWFFYHSDFTWNQFLEF